jgi:hypothetical protein
LLQKPNSRRLRGPVKSVNFGKGNILSRSQAAANLRILQKRACTKHDPARPILAAENPMKPNASNVVS